VETSEPIAQEHVSDRLTNRIGIGVLARVIPADLIDEVLIETKAMQQRVRLLPSRVVVYFVLSLSLFFGDAYEEVMQKLVQGLRFTRLWSSDWQVPTASALCQARRRLGEEPIRELFERVAVPLATPGSPGSWLGHWRLMAIDGVQLDVADTAENEDAFSRLFKDTLPAPYPQARVVGLGECGTHAIIAAQIGGCQVGERELATGLLGSLEPGMLLLADRGFYSKEFWREVAATGADLLWRVSASLKLAVLELFGDGSYRSVIIDTAERQRQRRAKIRGEDRQPAGITVRVVEYQITGRDGAGETIRLLTTIMDHTAATAAELAATYAERWEFEISLAELETRQRGPLRVLRSQSPEMTRQEIWGMLLVHYAIRALMAQVATDLNTDPDRVSFIRSLRIIRRQVTDQAAFSP
jgi:hypothetical protein